MSERRGFLKQATMALVAMGLPVDAIQMREPHVSSYPSFDLTTLDLIGKGDHQIVHLITNHGPRRVRLCNLMPGLTYLILVSALPGAVSEWDWDKGMLWRDNQPPALSVELGYLNIIYATCVATDRVLCSYSMGHR